MVQRKAGEFELIERLFQPLAADAPGAFGLKDDAAMLPPLNHGEGWVVTTDTMMEGSHWLAGSDGGDVAAKLLRVNLSDLAAMGAMPRFYTLSLALNRETPETWTEAFAARLKDEQSRFGVSLIGGDTVATSGPIAVTLTALGSVKRGDELHRKGAGAGEDVYLTGTIGDAALGLRILKGELDGLTDGAKDHLVRRHRTPDPRTTVGTGLVGIAAACIDISDGLVQDLGHVAAASGVSIVIKADAVPLSSTTREALNADPALMETILSGGDDYELAFTASRDGASAIQALSKETGVPISRIGTVEAGTGVSVRDGEGRDVTPKSGGFQHF